MKNLLILIFTLVFASLFIITFSSLTAFVKSRLPKNSAPSIQVDNRKKGDFNQLKIEEHMTYSFPDRWQSLKKNVSRYNFVNSKSEVIPYAHYLEYSSASSSAIFNNEDIRVHIEVQKEKVDANDYLNPDKYRDGEKTVIYNVDAVRSHYDDSSQGHFLEYRFIHNNLAWKIWIQTKDLESENTKINDINSFIKSIKLIKN